MTEDDGRVATALEEAERCFRDVRGQTHEAELDPTQPALTQLRKACRLLDACRVLRTHDGYHTSVIELSFGAIKRTIQFYIFDSTTDTLGEYQRHEAVYERGAELNLYSMTMKDQLLQLWRENRSATYYRNTVRPLSKPTPCLRWRSNSTAPWVSALSKLMNAAVRRMNTCEPDPGNIATIDSVSIFDRPSTVRKRIDALTRLAHMDPLSNDSSTYEA